ncbi:MAG TPA: DegT/DnrJ/EryC1/StrS family aminotransferase [Casimicrobiaceae bacterium]|nr:DegT/DnrJ/EryC1/StrS family aminotransferase [Casimicrobiaceae bacterium]
MSIQLFVPSFRVDECLAEIRVCLEKGWTGLGYKTVEFESAWKQYTGLPNAHFLSSNTAGLHLALEVLKRRNGWSAGDEVISTPLTFVSTNHAILHAGLAPVFADVDEHLCLDPASVLQRITPRTRAVMFVGIGGNVGRYAEIVQICRERGLTLVLDAAHMAGTRYRGAHVGAEADVAVFSFQAVKNLPTADSGMICFRDAESDAMARKMSWLGINKDTYTRTHSQETYKWMYDVEYLGYKYHGNSIMAAIALVQLKYLDQDNAYRRQVVAWYDADLAGIAGIRRIPLAPGCESATHLIQIRVKNRDALIVELNRNEVYPGVHYRDNTEYAMYSYGKGTCPEAHAASAQIVSLPLHLHLERRDVTAITDLLVRHVA